MTTLHDYWRSSASYRVRIALGLAGERWDAVSVDLTTGAQRAPMHLAKNPQGLVPALEIDGVLQTEGGVSVRATAIRRLAVPRLHTSSHDFY